MLIDPSQEKEQRFVISTFLGESLDADRAEHVDWVLERAKSRAEIFGIKGELVIFKQEAIP